MMKEPHPHLSDEQLLLELEGESSAATARHVKAHLQSCWMCRARRLEMENTIAAFVRVHHHDGDKPIPPIDGPRALLRARLAQLSVRSPNRLPFYGSLLQRQAFPLVAASFGLAALIMLLLAILSRHPAQAFPVVSIPDAKLTPGATVLADRNAVCSLANVKNKAVSPALRQHVFEEYGIRGVEPHAYEVDYLVTPALGGADDIRNLWPHSYYAAWNARVKDDLEDRLRELVCDGRVPLPEAQKEIAANWIAAYKKYFHTYKPLSPESPLPVWTSH